MKRVAVVALRVVCIVALWHLASRALHSAAFPTPSDLLDEVHHHGFHTVVGPARTTLFEAAAGFLIGNVVAVGIGAACVRFRRFEPVGLQFALLTYTVPVIAIGAIMTTLWSASVVRIVISGSYVVYVTVMGTAVGLRTVDARALDLMTAYGSSPRRQFALVRFPAAAPSMIAALRVAAPAAVLGAIVGEYLGGEGGLGVAMIASQRSGAVARTWLLALAGALLAGAGYWLLGGIGRRWAARSPSITIPRPSRTEPATAGWRSLARLGVAALAAAGLIVLGWYGALRLFHVNDFVGRTPADVAGFLFTASGAAAHRSELWDALAMTARHAGLGYLAGAGSGLVLAIVFHLVPRVERTLLPFAVAAQAVPVVAFLPLGLVLLGRGTALAALVAGLISFFPTLVYVDSALRQTPRVATDLLTANGATRTRQLLLARLPYAAPAVFTAARIAVPASVAGALLVEWMVLGNGMGDLMLGAATRYRYDQLWTAVVVVSLATIAIASLARLGERTAARRLGLHTGI